jgi:hypothetical protein
MKDKLKDLIKDLLREKKAAGVTEFEHKRREFADRIAKGYSPSAGEMANFIEGLTADGFDKHGVKVGFVERGTPVWGRQRLPTERISEKP